MKQPETQLPFISIVITTYNAAHCLEKALESISGQNYPAKNLELIVVDDNSEDNTVEIAKKYTDKIFYSGKRFCEISRALGIREAKHDLIFLIDADNALPDTNFLTKAVAPFLAEENLSGSFPCRFHYNSEDPPANRYCSIFGINDPFQYYTKAREHLTIFEKDWLIAGASIDKGDYYLISFDKDSLLTLGAIGFLGRRDQMLDGVTDSEYFFHSDAYNRLIKKGVNRFAAVKHDIVHDHCSSSSEFFKKLARNHKNYLLHNHLRGDVWWAKSKFSFLGTVLQMATILLPIKDSVYAYSKQKDIACFLHPFYSFGVVCMYSFLTIKHFLTKKN